LDSPDFGGVKMKKKWLGSAPTDCDLCHKPFVDVFFDAKTRFGPWGLICSKCFLTEGVGLGTGLGQKYDLFTLEKIEG